MTTRERFLLAASLVLLVATATMGPHLAPFYDLVSTPIVSVFGGRAAEFLLNALLFLPLGLFAGWARSPRAFVTVLVLACVVETVQTLLPRNAELFDLLAYIAGTAAGGALGARLARRD